MKDTRYHQFDRVEVEAPARLHLGFIDLSAVSGRRFGSLGLTLEGLGTRLVAEKSKSNSIHGPQSQRTLQYLNILHEQFSLPHGTKITVKAAIPAHSGLGSGTQLALAVGTAVSHLYDLNLSPREIAHLLDRGNRSGIGVGAFETGGFLVDGGRGSVDVTPPIVSRLAFPPSWRVLLFLDGRAEGLHGDDESNAFQKSAPFSKLDAAHISHLILMNVLPALLEIDIDVFGKALSEIQRIVGDYFSPFQGGRFASPLVTEILCWLEQQGATCVGQSSWGPTGFAIVESEARALSLLQSIEERWRDHDTLEVVVSQARNRGAEINVFNDSRSGKKMSSFSIS